MLLRRKKVAIIMVITMIMLSFSMIASAASGTITVPMNSTGVRPFAGQWTAPLAVVAGITRNTTNAGLDIELVGPNGAAAAYTHRSQILPVIAGTTEYAGTHVLLIINLIDPPPTVDYWTSP